MICRRFIVFSFRAKHLFLLIRGVAKIPRAWPTIQHTDEEGEEEDKKIICSTYMFCPLFNIVIFHRETLARGY